MYEVKAKKREKIRERVKEIALEIIDGEIAVSHPKGFVITSDIASKMKDVHPSSIAAYLKHNYEKWGLVKRSYGIDLSQRRWAYAKDPERIPPPPPRPHPKKTTKLEPKVPKRVEKLIDSQRRTITVVQHRKPPLTPKEKKIKQRLGETLKQWLVRIHEEKPRSYNEIVDLYTLSIKSNLGREPITEDKTRLLEDYNELLEEGTLAFGQGMSYKKSNKA